MMEALHVREGIEGQRARDAIKSNEDEMNRMGTRLRESFKHEAQEHVRLQEAQMKAKIHPYQMVIDANHRQSLSSKEQEILELRRQAEEDRRMQNERVAQLEQMVQALMQHNMKLQSMIESQFAQARPPPVVETAATTLHTRAEVALPEFDEREYVPPTSKAAPAAKPSMPTPGMSSWTPANPPIFGPTPGIRLGTDDESELKSPILIRMFSKVHSRSRLNLVLEVARKGWPIMLRNQICPFDPQRGIPCPDAAILSRRHRHNRTH